MKKRRRDHEQGPRGQFSRHSYHGHSDRGRNQSRLTAKRRAPEERDGQRRHTIKRSRGEDDRPNYKRRSSVHRGTRPRRVVWDTHPKGVVRVTGPTLHKETLATKSSVVVINDKEDDPRRLKQRQKQIDIGKNTLGYDRYSKVWPKSKRLSANRSRDMSLPQTPDKRAKVSKRQFDGMVRKWRRLLHCFDPPKTASAKEKVDPGGGRDRDSDSSADADTVKHKSRETEAPAPKTEPVSAANGVSALLLSDNTSADEDDDKVQDNNDSLIEFEGDDLL